MTYDHRKSTEPDDGAEMPEPGETELELLYAREARLRTSHDALLAAAKEVIAQADRDTNRVEDGTPNRTEECWKSYNLLCAAIAKAEELAP